MVHDHYNYSTPFAAADVIHAPYQSAPSAVLVDDSILTALVALIVIMFATGISR